MSLMSQLKGIWEGEHALSSLLFCVQIARAVMLPVLTRDESEREEQGCYTSAGLARTSQPLLNSETHSTVKMSLTILPFSGCACFLYEAGKQHDGHEKSLETKTLMIKRMERVEIDKTHGQKLRCHDKAWFSGGRLDRVAQVLQGLCWN